MSISADSGTLKLEDCCKTEHSQELNLGPWVDLQAPLSSETSLWLLFLFLFIFVTFFKKRKTLSRVLLNWKQGKTKLRTMLFTEDRKDSEPVRAKFQAFVAGLLLLYRLVFLPPFSALILPLLQAPNNGQERGKKDREEKRDSLIKSRVGKGAAL